jgi:transcription elongation factor Elf1
MTIPLLCCFPTCPSCDHEVTTDEALNMGEDLFALAPDEGRATINCPSCGIEYHIQGGYVPTYTTALDEDDL